MGFVVVTYKIFPTDIINDFTDMKKRLESSIPAHAEAYGYGEELVAYGLKALLVQVKFPEDETGLLAKFEKKLETMEGVSQVETLMVRRTSKSIPFTPSSISGQKPSSRLLGSCGPRASILGRKGPLGCTHLLSSSGHRFWRALAIAYYQQAACACHWCYEHHCCDIFSISQHARLAGSR